MSKRILALLLIGGSLLAACGGNTATRTANVASKEEQLAVSTGFQKMAAGQPVPVFDYSQLRQNLIEVQTAEANGVATTSFMFNLGVPDPIHVCPSVGYPIPSSDQLTSPTQVIHNRDGNFVVDQGDPVGVYRGDTTGTYVICVDENGKGYATYWEGFVMTIIGTAHWDAATHAVVNHAGDDEGFSVSKDQAKGG